MICAAFSDVVSHDQVELRILQIHEKSSTMSHSNAAHPASTLFNMTSKDHAMGRRSVAKLSMVLSTGVRVAVDTTVSYLRNAHPH